MGTAAYMSPVQAKGMPVDKRADIWAFACVLYEMLTGRRAIGGEMVPEVVAKILEHDPDFARLPSQNLQCTPAFVGLRLSLIEDFENACRRFLLQICHRCPATPQRESETSFTAPPAPGTNPASSAPQAPPET